MAYARARLWLGIISVGSVVTIAFVAYLIHLPKWLSANDQTFGVYELAQLGAITSLLMIWLFPLDYLGGFLLPSKYDKSNQSIAEWFRGYAVGAVTQALLFILFGSSIIFLSQIYGRLGGAVAVFVFTIACFTLRNRLLLKREVTSEVVQEKLVDAIAEIQSWQIFVPQIVVVEHSDIGFTGGVIGWGKQAKIVIPKAWLSFPTEKLAMAMARRALAISSGSYTRGLIVAFIWNVGGFLLCSYLPGAGLATVSALVITLCGFTVWSFLGLLTLPTVSRNASVRLDQALVERGMPLELISQTASAMDQLQDDEPQRPTLVEIIFHPVPSVSSRNRQRSVRGIAAWNVARTTLFFSWACLGFLSRAVHCNLGRPELWMMLPTD